MANENPTDLSRRERQIMDLLYEREKASVQEVMDGIADPPARLRSTGSIFATIYAPLAALSIPPTFELSGAVAARRLTVEAGARVHFDLALTAATLENGTLPRLSGWRLVELPDSPLVRLRLDPLRVLKASGMTLLGAPASHYDVGDVPPDVGSLPTLVQ